jgi:hypothetical protein
MLRCLLLTAFLIFISANAAQSQDAKKIEKDVFSITAQNCKAICAKGNETTLTDEKDKRHYKLCFAKAMCFGQAMPNALPLAVAPKIDYPTDAIKRLFREMGRGPNEVKG